MELNNLWNKIQKNEAHISNPTCVGVKFKLTICITNGSEWLSVEMVQINQERLEDAEAVRVFDNAKVAAETTPKATDTLIINHTCATETDIVPYPKLINPGRYVIDTNNSTKVITIEKIKQGMEPKDYAAYNIVDSVVQYYLRKLFETEFLPTCLPVPIFSSTSILPYKCNNILTPNSTNSIPATSKMN